MSLNKMFKPSDGEFEILLDKILRLDSVFIFSSLVEQQRALPPSTSRISFNSKKFYKKLAQLKPDGIIKFLFDKKLLIVNEKLLEVFADLGNFYLWNIAYDACEDQTIINIELQLLNLLLNKNYEMVRCILKKLGDETSKQLSRTILQHNQPKVLLKLSSYMDNEFLIDERCFVWAYSKKKFKMLFKMLAMPFSNDGYMTTYAIKCGSIDLLKRVMRLGFKLTEKCTFFAIEHKYILQYLSEIEYDFQNFKDAVKHCIKMNDGVTISYLVKFGYMFDVEDVMLCLKYDKLQILKCFQAQLTNQKYFLFLLEIYHSLALNSPDRKILAKELLKNSYIFSKFQPVEGNADKDMSAASSIIASSAADCCICCEKLKKKSLMVIKLTSCAHIFHQRCILNWFKEAFTCPVCREEIF